MTDNTYDARIVFVGCDSCENGVMTARGVECRKNLALICKPDLLQVPKFYRSYEEVHLEFEKA
jgi:hypothetical protein